MNWKKTGRFLLFPPAALIGLLWPAALALMTCGALMPETAEAVRITSYVLSFYALTVTVLRIPQLLQCVRELRQKNPYLVRYASDVRLRMNLSLLCSLAFNAVYAAFQLGLGLRHHSVWFYSMAVYYLLLAMMRLLLVQYTGRHAPGEQRAIEWRRYRLCGIFLLMMTLVLAVFLICFVLKIRVFEHHPITTITMATYTFASLGMAIYNAIRFRRYGSPAYSAARAISLVSAIVSVLTLENAMLTVFGRESSEAFRQIMLGTTGTAVILAVQGIAICMIINAGRKLRR